MFILKNTLQVWVVTENKQAAVGWLHSAHHVLAVIAPPVSSLEDSTWMVRLLSTAIR